MKITLTGSVGHISKPLTDELIHKGHAVTVVSSRPENRKEIEALGAIAAIGSMQDVDFITTAFTGADLVYTMVPPANYFDQNLDLKAFYHNIGNSYAQAIVQASVKRVINLSTIGGNMDKDNGGLRYAHDVEEILNKLPSEVSVTHMRPTSFYYNLYGYAAMIKETGVIATNYGKGKVPWVSPIDIAAAIADEISTPFLGRKARYVASEELTGDETAAILGTAIGKPDLKWVIVSDEQVQSGLEAIGMNRGAAAGLVEMYAGLNTGLLSENYNRNKPAVLGKVKMEDFAKEFAAAFHAKVSVPANPH